MMVSRTRTNGRNGGWKRKSKTFNNYDDQKHTHTHILTWTHLPCHTLSSAQSCPVGAPVLPLPPTSPCHGEQEEWEVERAPTAPSFTEPQHHWFILFLFRRSLMLLFLQYFGEGWTELRDRDHHPTVNDKYAQFLSINLSHHRPRRHNPTNFRSSNTRCRSIRR